MDSQPANGPQNILPASYALQLAAQSQTHTPGGNMGYGGAYEQPPYPVFPPQAQPEYPGQTTGGAKAAEWSEACVQQPGAPLQVVTAQGVPDSGVPGTGEQVYPSNNSLLVASLVMSICSCISGICCFFPALLCAIPAVILSSISMCSKTATNPSDAKRKNTIAMIGLAFALVPLVFGILFVLYYSVIVIKYLNLAEEADNKKGSCNPLYYGIPAIDCSVKFEFSFFNPDYYCCCKGLLGGCYIDGINKPDSECLTRCS